MKSYSQYKQEDFVCEFFKNKTNGFFVELGGLDGIRHSNTYLLENKYMWNGLIIEPSPSLYLELKENRNVITENILISNKYEKGVDFLYIEDKTKCIGLQGIMENYNKKHLNRIRNELNNDSKFYNIIKMDTTTLQKICEKYKIYNIDYLSLDVEGSELKVLQGIDFNKINITLIGVEINYEENKKGIFDILNNDPNYIFIKKLGDYFFKKK